MMALSPSLHFPRQTGEANFEASTIVAGSFDHRERVRHPNSQLEPEGEGSALLHTTTTNQPQLQSDANGFLKLK